MKFKNYFKKKNGFTLVELILASSISLSTILIGFYVLRNIIEGNKIDEIQVGLNSQVNDAIDFIIDEVESGERIIDTESDKSSKKLGSETEIEGFVPKLDPKLKVVPLPEETVYISLLDIDAANDLE